jgi:hypothetical protein
MCVAGVEVYICGVERGAAKWSVLPVVAGWREVPAVSSTTTVEFVEGLSKPQHEDLS